jgi:hypothetical protein
MKAKNSGLNKPCGEVGCLVNQDRVERQDVGLRLGGVALLFSFRRDTGLWGYPVQCSER